MMPLPHHLRHRRVLVTGAAGFVGRHLCAALQQSGALVLATSRRAFNEGFEYFDSIPGDITDAAFVTRLLEESEPEYVFHLAAVKTRSNGMADFRLATDTNFGLHFGTAVDLKVDEAIRLGLGARYHVVFSPTSGSNFWSFMFRAGYFFEW